MGQRLTDDDQRPGAVPGRPVDVQVRAARQVRHAGSASCCRTPPKSSTTSRSSSRVHTEAINHDPAFTFVMTGSELPGRPSLGSWLSYGLGSENNDLPAFVVLTPQWQSGNRRPGALHAALGQRLPAEQVPGRRAPRAAATRCCTCRTRPASTPTTAARMLDALGRAQPAAASTSSATRRRRPASPSTRWPSACRPSVPELTDLSQRAAADVLDLYGPDVAQARHVRRQLPAGPPAGRARRPLRPALPPRLGPARQPARATSPASARTSTRPTAALVTDLKQRGLLDDTLVVWGGEFGRTVYCQGKLTNDNYGRDHHPRCFTHLAGRRRHQGRASPTARPTTSATTSSRTRSTSTT